MGTEQVVQALAFGEISDIGYAIVTKILQPRLKEDGVKEGSATWTTCPFDSAAAIRAERKTSGLSMRYTVESDALPAAATLMLTKSMLYALYAGCLDLLKRDPDWRARSFPAGTEVETSATVGTITMTLTMRVIGLRIVDDDEDD